MRGITKRVFSIALSMVMALSVIGLSPVSITTQAASKPALSQKKASIYVGSTKTIKLKSAVSGTITVSSNNSSVVTITKVKKTVKKSSAAYFKIKGVSAGSTKISVKVRLKKKVGGKKTFSYTVNVNVKEKPVEEESQQEEEEQEEEEKGEYTVTYTHNLGSNAKVTGMPDPLVVKVPKKGDKTVTLPAEPKCEGYKFDCWYYNGEKKPGQVITVSSNITVTAKFSKIKYTIHYDTGAKNESGIKGSISDSTVEHGNSFYITSTKPTWEKHKFTGWKLSGKDTIYKPGQKVENVTANMTFYAVWDEDKKEEDEYELTAEERAVYDKIVAKKTAYPQGKNWTDSDIISWYAFYYAPRNTTVTARGCVALACILSDAVFGECSTSRLVAPARQIDNPSASDIKIGDIIRFNNNSHSAIVMAKTSDSFVLAEGNYNSSVNWGRKIPMTTSIDFVWTRWKSGSGLTPTTLSDVEEERNYYTVTYTHNLSSDKVVTGMPNPLVVQVPKDGDHKLTLPQAPSCTGYSFDSWIYLNDYRKSPGTVVTVDKDMTIKARFVRNSASGYIIQYETGAAQNPDIMGVVSGTLLGYGETLTITTVQPSWAGHVFSGWYLRGYDTLYQPGQRVSGISSDLTFYAAWDQGAAVPQTDTASSGPTEAEVLERMLALKSKYPEGSTFPPGEFKWYFGSHFSYLTGSHSFCCQLMDAGFESVNELNKAKDITSISIGASTYNIRIGDVLQYSETFGGESLYAIVVGYSGSEYIVAEANDGTVHWGTRMARPSNLIGITTRW